LSLSLAGAFFIMLLFLFLPHTDVWVILYCFTSSFFLFILSLFSTWCSSN
jgi:hypothetical protein